LRRRFQLHRWLVSFASGREWYPVEKLWEKYPGLPTSCAASRARRRNSSHSHQKLVIPDHPAHIVVASDSIAVTDGLRIWELRRIRAELVELDLDWAAPPYPPAPEPTAALAPLTVTVDMGDLLRK
jgi:hypothetical protein